MNEHDYDKEQKDDKAFKTYRDLWASENPIKTNTLQVGYPITRYASPMTSAGRTPLADFFTTLLE